MRTHKDNSILSAVILRNLFLLVAGAVLFFWPLAQRVFASIVACSGCSCDSTRIDALASCTAIAQCWPEGKLLIVNSSIEYLCPNTSVFNEATTTGYINGYNIFATQKASTVFYGRVCHNAWAIEQCDGYKTSGVTTEDMFCCDPPPPPPPTCPKLYYCDPNNPDPTDPCCGASPILIDVGGQGFALTNPQNGVKFDISGKGLVFQIAWTAPGANNAFLCLPDLNGMCDDGKDLFGNFTPQPSSSSPNGFAALAVYDQPANGGNGDGIIDSRDAIFSVLRLWIDVNHDGISQPNEIFTLPSLGIYSISLDYKLSERVDQYGNRFRYRAKVNPDRDDVGRWAYDVFLVLQAGSTTAVKSCPPSTTVPSGRSARASTR